MAKSPAMAAFSAPLQPILAGGDGTYTMKAITGLTQSLAVTQDMTPQQATKVPKIPRDGMRRLARYPWWPISGQTADAWVYYDAVGKVWRLEGTAPTSSH